MNNLLPRENHSAPSSMTFKVLYSAFVSPVLGFITVLAACHSVKRGACRLQFFQNRWSIIISTLYRDKYRHTIPIPNIVESLTGKISLSRFKECGECCLTHFLF